MRIFASYYRIAALLLFILFTFTPGLAQTSLQIALTAPTTQTSYTATQNALVLRGTASGPSAVQRIGWRISPAGLAGTATGTESWEINNIGLRQGLNTIVLTAQDFAGRSATFTLNVTYQNPVTATEIIVQSPVAGTVLPSNAIAKVAWAIGGTIPPDWPLSNNIPVVSLDILQNGTRVGTLIDTVSALTNTLVNLGGIPDGDGYQIKVNSRDANGGKGLYSGLSAPFRISNNGAPSISTFTATAPNQASGSAATVKLGEDLALRWTLAGGVTNQLMLAASNAGTADSVLGRETIILRPAQTGQFTYTLTASNSAGSASQTVTVDVVAPSVTPAATETLYNGITLPAVWPPKPADYLDISVLPSYLTNPPAVIPISVGRQLFVDDFLIESSSLTRQFHPAILHEASPVLTPTTPVEKSINGAMAMPFSSGVFYDPSEKLFKMWYECGYRINVCYATSNDGLTWVRPALDVVPGTNIIYQDTRYVDGYTVWLDLAETDATRRYKMMRVITETGLEMNLHYSSDGIHWSAPVVSNRILPGDRSTIFYNPFRQRWGLSLRNFVTPEGRVRHYHEHRDLSFALSSIVKAPASSAETLFQDISKWAKADRLDTPHPNDPTADPQLYNLDVAPYESLLLGQFSILRGRAGLPSGRPKLNHVYFGFSRDGFNWNRPYRQPMFAPSEQSGSWNWGNVQSVAGGPLIVGDQMYFYFSARAGSTSGGNIDAGGSTGLATMRRDGFASLNADTTAGIITTRKVTFEGQHLFVNADVAADGSLCAEVLDVDNQVIAPFSRDNCIPFTGNKTKQLLGWNGATDLSSVAGQVVKLRFYLSKGKLYSFWVSPSSAGTSMGFVGAGGPAFTGLRDDNPQAPNPVQASLTPATQTVIAGQTVSLTYQVSNAESAQLTPALPGCEIDLTVSNTGTCTFTPASANNYSWKLQAQNAGQTAVSYAQVTAVEPVAAPAISAFAANQTQILANQPITLTWTLTGGPADSVHLAPNIGLVLTSNSITVVPLQTTTYTLTASNIAGTVTRSVTVTIIPDTVPPQVTPVAPTITYWPAGTQQVNVEVATSENASCRVGPATNAPDFAALDLFAYTGGTTHRTAIATQDNTSYAYVVRCADASGNLSSALSLNFRIASITDTNSNNAIQLDGLNSVVKTSPRSSVATRQWSMEAWIKTSATPGDFQTILGNQSGNDLRITSGLNAKILVSIYNGSFNNFFGTRRVNDGNWHHVVVVRDADKLYVYLDGTVETESNTRLGYLPLANGGNNSNLNLLSIGNRGTASEWFNGSVDEVRVYTRSLTASEAAAHYNNGLGIAAGPDANLWLGFDFNETTGAAFDFSSNNTLGNLNGAATRVPRFTVTPPDTTPPAVTITAPTLRTFPASTTQLTLQLSTNENAQCKFALTSGVPFGALTGTFDSTGALTHSLNFNSLTAGQSYTRYLSCADSAGNASSALAFTFNIEAPPPPPSIASFTIATGSGSPGNTAALDLGQSVTLAWSTANVTSASISGTNCVITPLNSGSCTHTPSQAGTFNLTLTAQGDSASGTPSVTSSVTLVVTQPPDTQVPVVTITNPLSLTTNQAMITLSGTTTDNIGVSAVTFQTDRGQQGAASGTLNWTANVPLVTGPNLITVNATDAANNTGTATITVNYTETPPPTATVTPSSTTITTGQSLDLTFDSTNAAQVSIMPAIAGCALTPNAALTCTVSPATNTTYTLTATDAFARAVTASATIIVQPALAAPVINAFTVTPSQIIAGQSATLAWQLGGGATDALTLDQGIGSVLTLTSQTITPAQSTTYLLTASNAAGTASRMVTVTVLPPDVTPPQLSLTSPMQTTFPAGTAQVSIALNTDEIAACRLATSSDTAFASMSLLSNTGSQSHSHNYATQDGQSYTLFLRCADSAGNISSPVPVSFTISQPPASTNGALQLDGLTGYVSMPKRYNLSTLKWTLSVWINTANSVNDFQTVLGNQSGNEVRLYGGSNGRVLVSAYVNGFVNYFGKRKVNDGLWHHIVAVRDNNRLYLYVDGTIDNDSETGLPYKLIPNGTAQSSFNLRAIGNRGTANEWYKGQLDDVRGYSRALSGQEIAAQYNSGAGMPVTAESGMLFGFGFGETGALALDVTPDLRHGQLTGGATRIVR